MATTETRPCTLAVRLVSRLSARSNTSGIRTVLRAMPIPTAPHSGRLFSLTRAIPSHCRGLRLRSSAAVSIRLVDSLQFFEASLPLETSELIFLLLKISFIAIDLSKFGDYNFQQQPIC